MDDSKQPYHQVWVVFSGKTELWWLHILKPGFRHCYAILHDGNKWVSYDPLAPHTEITVHYDIDSHFNLPQWLAGQGQLPVPASIDWDKKKASPPMVFSCVEAVKKLLGVHQFFVLTPWQLYRYLLRSF